MGADFGFGEFGQVDTALHPVTKFLRAVGTQAHPQFQRARASRQLEAAIAEIDRAGGGLHVFQVLRRHRVALLQGPRSVDHANEIS